MIELVVLAFFKPICACRIYGGGFSGGGGNETRLNGSYNVRLMEQKRTAQAAAKTKATESLVVVTFNYRSSLAIVNRRVTDFVLICRLNVFGFLGSDDLRPRDPAGGTGNYGILDQRAAMRWVHENIAQVG